MSVTAEQVLGQITAIDNAIRQGLAAGNLKAVMKDQKRALVSDRHPLRTSYYDSRDAETTFYLAEGGWRTGCAETFQG
jgi:hypothetical protein